MHYFVPARRSTTNLLQSSGELWVGEAEEAPLRFAVIASDRPLAGWLDPVMRSIAELGPDDAVFERLPIEELPGVDGTIAPPDPVLAFWDALSLAEGILVLVDANPDTTAAVVRALGWSAQPDGEGALEDLPVVVLGVAGDAEELAATVGSARAAVIAGAGQLIEMATDVLAGDWAERVAAGGRLDDVPTRQAIGQATLLLRHAADANLDDSDDESGDVADDAAGDANPGADTGRLPE